MESYYEKKKQNKWGSCLKYCSKLLTSTELTHILIYRNYWVEGSCSIPNIHDFILHAYENCYDECYLNL